MTTSDRGARYPRDASEGERNDPEDQKAQTKQIATRFGVAACHVRKIAMGKFAWEHL